ARVSPPRMTGCGSGYSIQAKAALRGAGMVAIRVLAERDLPEAQRIIHRAFGTFLGVPDLEKFWFPPYAHTRFGAEHIASFAAERDGTLAGSNFSTNWGSVGFFGPLTTRPVLWDAEDAMCSAP